MRKFKKGDRVRVLRSFERTVVGTLGVVERERDNGTYSVRVNPYEGFNALGVELELISSPSPIREKTVKEIVPGKYGLFTVGSCHGGFVEVVQSKDGRDEMMSATELRDAARLFTELAEYLESKESE